MVIDEEELRRLSPAERRELARALARLDRYDPRGDAGNIRRRRLGLLVMTAACVFLAGWIAVLELTLPRHYTAGDWRAAWVGFDIALFAGFATTAWAAWRERQVVVITLLVTATLLCADAWFDVMLDLGTSAVWMSVVSALVAELPLAFALFAAARRIIRHSVRMVMSLEGLDQQVPSLWRIPLFGEGIAETLPRRFRAAAREQAGRAG